jgi:hypothetical protein
LGRNAETYAFTTIEKKRNPHSRCHEGVSRNPIRASAKDPDVIYLEEPRESRLVDQLVLHNADATESDPLSLGIKYLTLLKPWDSANAAITFPSSE